MQHMERSRDGKTLAVLRDGAHVFKLPLAWTDAAPADPFVVQAAGRSLFRPVDLLAVAELVERLRRQEV